MQSDGALADFRKFSGLRAILCTYPEVVTLFCLWITAGPAGGVVGFSRTSYDPIEGSPVVGFDMGGTVSDPYSNPSLNPVHRRFSIQRRVRACL